LVTNAILYLDNHQLEEIKLHIETNKKVVMALVKLTYNVQNPILSLGTEWQKWRISRFTVLTLL